MKLDRTRIAIRERSLLDTVDLALFVTREFAGPLIAASLLAIVPLALLNYALVGWMVPSDYEGEWVGFRYLWNMTLLIFLEAPLAAVFVVAFLGPAVFLEKGEERTVRQVARDVLRQLGAITLCQGILRGVLIAWVLYLLTSREEANGFIEGFVMLLVVLWSAAMRAFRPYINEIILLEQNPLLSRGGAAITVGKRSSHLHSPYSGDLFVRWLGSAAIAWLLAGLVLMTAIAAMGYLISDWPIHFSLEDESVAPNFDWFKLQVVYPACLWIIVAFFAVVRFLSYLDLRIRHEGWEVELLMRAEAQRLAAQLN
jgi:hypothetical protein